MKAIKFIGAFVLVVVLAAFTVNKHAGGYKVGDVATDFSLKNINNKNVSLKDFKDAKGYIVIFHFCFFRIAVEYLL